MLIEITYGEYLAEKDSLQSSIIGLQNLYASGNSLAGYAATLVQHQLDRLTIAYNTQFIDSHLKQALQDEEWIYAKDFLTSPVG